MPDNANKGMYQNVMHFGFDFFRKEIFLIVYLQFKVQLSDCFFQLYDGDISKFHEPVTDKLIHRGI